ncbi:hypothetical protein ACIHCQ_34185 [Streptomyces sp. NPDC052236]|uniref:hypothetical protein n=1 Tax=Streptomyces sp. NPDC052236 TaxID=3365686 RepID=UPI0037D220F7
MFVFALLMYPALFAVPVWLIAVAVKLISVALPGRRTDWSVDLLRWCVGMAAAAAVGLCVLGLGMVQFEEHDSQSGADSTPSHSCRDVPPSTMEHLFGQQPSYLPLGFDCVLDDGTTYPSSDIYAWMNALIVGFGVGAVVLAVAGGFVAERRARAQADA